jgi:hypothetical protein
MDAVENPQSHRAYEARRSVTTSLMAAFAGLSSDARKLISDGAIEKANVWRVLAAGMTSGIAFELVSGIVVLSMHRVAYGSAALTRQLVEIEYLAWAISEGEDDARDWLTSTKHDRLARWQPGKIRSRAAGRFPNTDYWDHCEVGGHPTPKGAQSILDNRDVWTEVGLYEAALHGSNAWHYLLKSFEGVSAEALVASRHDKLNRALAEWRKSDPLVRVGHS